MWKLTMIGKVGSRVAPASSLSSDSILSLGWPEVDLLAPSCTNQCLHCYTSENSYLWDPWGWKLKPPWTSEVSYVIPPVAPVSLVWSKFLVEHFIGKLRLLILVAPCWMNACWITKVLCMLEDIPHWCPIVEVLVMDVSVSWVPECLQLLH